MSNQNPGSPPDNAPATQTQGTGSPATTTTADTTTADTTKDSNYGNSPHVEPYRSPSDLQPVPRAQGLIYGVFGARMPIPVQAASTPVVDAAAQRLQTRAAQVDLDLGSLNPSQGGFDLRQDIVSNARIAQTGGGRFAQYFQRFFSSGKGTGATPSALRAELVDREIARAYRQNPKVKQLLGQIYADRQTDVSTALAENNLSTLLQPFAKKPPKGLQGDDLAAYKEVQKRFAAVRKLLGLKADAPVTDDDLKTLYASGDDAKVQAAHDLLAAASKACKRSAVIDAVLEGSDVVPVRYNVTGPDPVDAIETSTAYIKALRAKITNMVFEGEVGPAMFQAAMLVLDDPNDINNLYACIGFNRVMSPNNLRGASLSSDIDFKLVLDDEKLNDKARSDLLTSRMYRALQKIGDSFSTDFGLTLEVKDFALKGLKRLGEDATSDEGEKNFLTTAVENQVLMSGNPEVQEKFNKIIKTKLLAAAATTDKEPGLPVRVFNQYLGDSDKGSIRTLKYLSKIEEAMEATADKIASDPSLSGPAMKKLKVQSVDALKAALENPTSMADLFKDDDFHKAAIAAKLVDGVPSSDDVPMFGSKDAYSRFKALAKNLQAFHGDAGSFIGSDNANEGNWVFSNKFSGCRINDFFDAVSADRYRAYKGVLDTDGAEPNATYHPGVAAALDARFKNARHVAGGINGFAIQLQMLVYRKYMATTQHAKIDPLYDKMTADQFDELLSDPSLTAHLKKSIAAMTAELDDLEPSVGETSGEVDAYRKKLKAQIAVLKEAAGSLDDRPADPLETLGLPPDASAYDVEQAYQARRGPPKGVLDALSESLVAPADATQEERDDIQRKRIAVAQELQSVETSLGNDPSPANRKALQLRRVMLQAQLNKTPPGSGKPASSMAAFAEQEGAFLDVRSGGGVDLYRQRASARRKAIGFKLMKGVAQITADTAELLDPRVVPKPIPVKSRPRPDEALDPMTRRKTSASGHDAAGHAEQGRARAARRARQRRAGGPRDARKAVKPSKKN